jgi:hypothetical protein
MLRANCSATQFSSDGARSQTAVLGLDYSEFLPTHTRNLSQSAEWLTSSYQQPKRIKMANDAI